LTPAGAILLDKGRLILAQTNEIFTSIVQDSESNLPCLTIGMAESVANTVGYLLVKELKPLTRHWRIRAGISPDQNEALLDHAVDLIITTSNVLDPLENLENHLILTEPFVVVFPASYQHPTGGLSELKNFPLIRYSLRSAIGRQIEGQIKRLKINQPVEIEFDTATSQIAAIAEGMGWGITTPMCLLQERVRLPQLKIEPLRRGAFSRSIKVVARAGNLGRIPVTVATTCSRLLHQQLFPVLLTQHPWIEDLMIWPKNSGK
jgi:DNA-binding transcriptional LysR family regulator